LHRREKKGLLAGMWEFPNFLTESGTPAGEERPASPLMTALPELEKTAEVKKHKKAKHIFSHVEWHMEGIWIEAEGTGEKVQERLIQMMRRLTGEKESAQTDEWLFASPEEMQKKYPMPSAFEAYYKEVYDENRNRL
ncbi:MAG: NUDIX domain-containing protein, partial [Lachnospiraceae bacterium]